MDRPLINTVPEAIDFLRRINVEVIGIWHGWIVRGMAPGHDFEWTLDSNTELIELARDERNQRVKPCEGFGHDLREPLPVFHSFSSAARSGPADPASKDPASPRLGKARKEVQP